MSVSSSSETSTSFALSWDPPAYEDQNGVIILYAINILVQETEDSFDLESLTTELTVSNLDPYRTYICKVAAATYVGEGPFSSVIYVYTLETGISLFFFIGF